MRRRDSQHSGFDETAPHDNDGRSKTRTGFNPNDAPSQTIERNGEDVSKWKWLNKVNDGIYDKDRETQNDIANKKRLVDVVCSSLDCTDYQTERAKQLLDGVDVSVVSDKSETAVLAAVSLVANQDGWHVQRPSNIPSDNRGPNVTVDGREIATFVYLTEQFNTTNSAVHKARNRLRKRL